MIGSGPGSGWPALALTCACAGLVYLLFVNLTKRKLGAPLMAAVLFGAHPATLAWLTWSGDVWRGLAGTALALLSGILLARTPLQPKLLWPSLAAYAVSLALSPGGAAIPFLVAAAIVAYHGLDPARLATKRLAPRFLVFLVPLACSVAWSVTNAPRDPVPVRHVPDLLLDLTMAHRGGPFGGGTVLGAAIVVAMAAFGLARLRKSPKCAWPLLAAALSLAAAAFLGDAWQAGCTPAMLLASLALLAAEGIEELFYRFGGAVAMPLLLVVYAALAVQSHLAAPPH